MTEHAQSKSERNAKVCGISFDPLVFDQLEAEASRMERPNRSLVVERALKLYFRIESQKQQGQTVIVLTEGAA